MRIRVHHQLISTLNFCFFVQSAAPNFFQSNNFLSIDRILEMILTAKNVSIESPKRRFRNMEYALQPLQDTCRFKESKCLKCPTCPNLVCSENKINTREELTWPTSQEMDMATTMKHMRGWSIGKLRIYLSTEGNRRCGKRGTSVETNRCHKIRPRFLFDHEHEIKG